jgi:ATP-dependent RNA helicase RhlE
VLDEADRMLEGDSARHPARAKNSARPPADAVLQRDAADRALSKEMLKSPATINIERRSSPAVGITHAVYPVPQHLKPALLLHLLKGADMHDALVFTRTKHRANRLAKFLGDAGVKVERIHGNRSQSQRTEALAGFKSGKYRVLVATDIAARRIGVAALGHVVNFDVRTWRTTTFTASAAPRGAAATGSATLVYWRGRRSARHRGRRSRRDCRGSRADFDYNARPQQNLDQRPPRPARSASRPHGHGSAAAAAGAIRSRASTAPVVGRASSPGMTEPVPRGPNRRAQGGARFAQHTRRTRAGAAASPRDAARRRHHRSDHRRRVLGQLAARGNYVPDLARAARGRRIAP